MHGEATTRGGRIHRYYGATPPAGIVPRCVRPVRRAMPGCSGANLNRPFTMSCRAWRRLTRCTRLSGIACATPADLSTRKNPALRPRLDEQLERAKRLFEYGEYDWETFCARRDEIQQQLSHLADAAAKPESVDLDWCEAQLMDLVAAWEAADSGQRSRLVSGIFEQLEAEALIDDTIRVVAIPREAWRPFFAGLVLERETGFEPATSTLARSRSTK